MRRHSFGFPLNMRQYQRAYILFFSKVNKIVYPSAYVSVLHYGATRTKKKSKCKYASRDKQYEQQRRRTNTFESSTSLFTVESSTVIVAAFVIEVKPSNK